MRPIRLLPLALVLFAMMALLFARDACAQTVLDPTAPPTLTAAALLALVLPLVLGAINAAVQTGEFAARWTIPNKWMPWVALVGSFLGGANGYLSVHNYAATAGTIVYAVVFGFGSVFLGATPGLALHKLTGKPMKRPSPDAASPTVVK